VKPGRPAPRNRDFDRAREAIKGRGVTGISVHIAARVQGAAAPGEILVSGTVRDVATGSGLPFNDRGNTRKSGRHGMSVEENKVLVRHLLEEVRGGWSPAVIGQSSGPLARIRSPRPLTADVRLRQELPWGGVLAV